MPFVRPLTRFSGCLTAGSIGLVGCLEAPETGLTLENTEGALTRADWCDARAAIQNKCVRCHTNPRKNAAPFSLETYADTQVPAPTKDDPEATRADHMRRAVESGAMPFTGFLLDPPVEDLTCEERATLLDWLRNGAEPPAGGDAECNDVRARTLECEQATGAGGDGG